MSQTNIDPFAPGDSPQHPSNWRPEDQRVADTLANMHEWLRDHYAMLSEADRDIPLEELQERHERHDQYLADFGSPEEELADAPHVPMPELMKRAVFSFLGDEAEVEEWKQLFELHGTADERDPLWVEGFLPQLDELRARAGVTELSATGGVPIPKLPPETVAAITEEFAQASGVELPPVPKANALKEDWVEFAQAVERARGGERTAEEIEAMSVADLKANYKPQAS